MSKPKMRARLKSLSFTEKIKILEKLRDRSEKIAASGLRQPQNKSAAPKESSEPGETS